MGVSKDVERFLARLFARSQSGYENARRLGITPTEIVVHLSPGGDTPPEAVADALCAAFPLGRVVRGVDILTGAIELRIYFDITILSSVRTWLNEKQAPHEISFLY